MSWGSLGPPPAAGLRSPSLSGLARYVLHHLEAISHALTPVIPLAKIPACEACWTSCNTTYNANVTSCGTNATCKVRLFLITCIPHLLRFTSLRLHCACVVADCGQHDLPGLPGQVCVDHRGLHQACGPSSSLLRGGLLLPRQRHRHDPSGREGGSTRFVASNRAEDSHVRSASPLNAAHLDYQVWRRGVGRGLRWLPALREGGRPCARDQGSVICSHLYRHLPDTTSHASLSS